MDNLLEKKMVSTDTANKAVKEQTTFAEEASKQLLIRNAGCLQVPELIYDSFIVHDTVKKEIFARLQGKFYRIEKCL